MSTETRAPAPEPRPPAGDAPFPLRLAIVSHVAHHDDGGRLHAYAPYAREIELWADLFAEVTIVAPRAAGPPATMSAPIDRPNVRLEPQRQTGGPRPGDKLRQLLLLPALAVSLFAALRRADAVHVRCPGNLGLLGVLLAPLAGRPRIAKYAGQWGAYPGEPWSFRLQRALLRSRWWRAPVTVYGRWPGQPAQVVPFFTSMLDAADLERARATADRPRPDGPLRVLFVGRLSTAKNVDSLIDAVRRVVDDGLELELTIVGDGPDRPRLETLAAPLGERVVFTGGLPFAEVLDHYARHDVLVLISRTEGWPKAIAEAMAFGLICIGSDRGLIPQMLDDGRGLVVPPGDAPALAHHLAAVARAPVSYRSMRQAAAVWGQRHSLEALREALRALLRERWGIDKR